MAKTATKSTSTARKTKTTVKPAKGTVAPRVGQPKYSDSAKIVILPAGKDNPRRPGKGPFKRYAVLLKSKTVGQFLKELPDWRSTINRAVKDELIEVKE